MTPTEKSPRARTSKSRPAIPPTASIISQIVNLRVGNMTLSIIQTLIKNIVIKNKK
jgi:hypothetical protein